MPSNSELFDHLEDWEEYIDTRLNTLTSAELGQWLAAISISKNILSKYCSKTNSLIYASVTYFDPGMSESYWMEAGYEDEWIARAREQVREFCDTRYALHSRAISQGINTVAGSEDSVQRAMKNEPVSQAMSFLCTSKEVMPFQTLDLLCDEICMLPSLHV